jgi:hypothetical protein
MEILNKITDLQNQGFSDSQISEQLQNEGLSPKEINEGINQAKIKNAISPPQDLPLPQFPDETPPQFPVQSPGQPEGYLQPQEAQPENYPPEQIMQPPVAPTQQDNQNLEPYDQNQGYYPQSPQAYSGDEYYMPNAGPDMGTTTEIVEQVVSEKFRDFEKKTGDLKSFQTLITDKVADLDARLKNIENAIDKLSNAVIGKIGEFGQNSAAIHKDLSNLHGTVSKLMNPLMDNLNELKKISK